MRKFLFPLALLSSTLFLSGCLGSIMTFFCDDLPDPDHCYQNAAIQEDEETDCEKILGRDFNSMQGNPPRDKCYLTIAVNTCDKTVCQQIKGGLISYSIDECEDDVDAAKKAGNCPESSGSSSKGSSSSDESSSDGKRECTFDDDCKPICEGSTMRKRGCTHEYKCELINERTDCAVEAETVVTSQQTYKFPDICLIVEGEAKCRPDAATLKATLQPEYDRLRKEFDSLQKAAQDLNDLYQKANKICLSTLSDVTDKLIIDSALALKAPPKALFDVMSDQLQNLINAAAGLSTADGKPAPRMTSSPEEAIALWCNLTKEISGTEQPLIDKKRNKVSEDIRAIKAALDQIPL